MSASHRTPRQFRVEGRLQQALLGCAQVHYFSLVVDGHQPNLRIRKKVVVDHPETTTLPLPRRRRPSQLPEPAGPVDDIASFGVACQERLQSSVFIVLQVLRDERGRTNPTRTLSRRVCRFRSCSGSKRSFEQRHTDMRPALSDSPVTNPSYRGRPVTMTAPLVLARHVGRRQTFAPVRRPFRNQTTAIRKPERRGPAGAGARWRPTEDHAEERPGGNVERGRRQQKVASTGDLLVQMKLVAGGRIHNRAHTRFGEAMGLQILICRVVRGMYTGWPVAPNPKT